MIEPEQETGKLFGPAALVAPPLFFAPPLEQDFFSSFRLTGIGSERNSPTVLESPPVVNEVTSGSPPTSRYRLDGSLPDLHALLPRLIFWVTAVPGRNDLGTGRADDAPVGRWRFACTRRR